MVFRKLQKLLLVSPLLFVFLFSISEFASAAPDGKAIFGSTCASCHYVGKGILIGPDLKDVQKRRPEDWLLKWVKNSSAVIKSGDAYAVELYGKFNKTDMPPQALADDEIKAVLAYIKAEGEKAPVAKVGPGSGVEGEEGSSDSDNSFLTLLIIGLILASLAFVLTRVKRSLEKVVRQKKGLPEPVELPFRARVIAWSRNNKKLIAILLILFTVWSSVKAWYVLLDVGVSQGYQPEQPIKFSHKLHAGDMGISCIYCHSGAEKSKTAGVPSANVCMNCHKAIKEGPTTGSTEIAKIYAALDYDPATQTYGSNQKPITWTRVHNLPDFAYFNHSQHVKVGGVKCQTCHGPVEEMTVAKQFSPLTMGWCIDCHRNTKVNMEGNHYYDNYHALHMSKLGNDSTVTVEKIGGTECARCHY